jgi:hypothetical protein
MKKSNNIRPFQDVEALIERAKHGTITVSFKVHEGIIQNMRIKAVSRKVYGKK